MVARAPGGAEAVRAWDKANDEAWDKAWAIVAAKVEAVGMARKQDSLPIGTKIEFLKDFCDIKPGDTAILDGFSAARTVARWSLQGRAARTLFWLDEMFWNKNIGTMFQVKGESVGVVTVGTRIKALKDWGILNAGDEAECVSYDLGTGVYYFRVGNKSGTPFSLTQEFARATHGSFWEVVDVGLNVETLRPGDKLRFNMPGKHAVVKLEGDYWRITGDISEFAINNEVEVVERPNPGAQRNDYFILYEKPFDLYVRIPAPWVKDHLELAGQPAANPAKRLTNDGREFCFDASCGGKVKQVQGILSVMGVCTRCKK